MIAGAPKTTYRSPLYLLANEGNRGFSFLPANYLHGVSYDASVIYDKFKRYRATESVTTRFTLLISVNYLKLFRLYRRFLLFKLVMIPLRFIILLRSIVKEGLFEYINYMLSILL